MGISYASGTAPFPSDTIWDLTAKLLLATTGGGGGGAVGKQVYHGTGDPNGVVTALNVGPSLYLDAASGRQYWKTDGLLTNSGWV